MTAGNKGGKRHSFEYWNQLPMTIHSTSRLSTTRQSERKLVRKGAGHSVQRETLYATSFHQTNEKGGIWCLSTKTSKARKVNGVSCLHELGYIIILTVLPV